MNLTKSRERAITRQTRTFESRDLLEMIKWDSNKNAKLLIMEPRLDTLPIHRTSTSNPFEMISKRFRSNSDGILLKSLIRISSRNLLSISLESLKNSFGIASESQQNLLEICTWNPLEIHSEPPDSRIQESCEHVEWRTCCRVARLLWISSD